MQTSLGKIENRNSFIKCFSSANKTAVVRFPKNGENGGRHDLKLNKVTT